MSTKFDSEKELEKELVRFIQVLGGLCIKLLSTVSGLPDRLVLLPSGIAFFVELKSKGKKPRALQQVWFRRLEAIDFAVFVVDSEETLNHVKVHAQNISKH